MRDAIRRGRNVSRAEPIMAIAGAATFEEPPCRIHAFTKYVRRKFT
jgi:hypothetical protein